MTWNLLDRSAGTALNNSNLTASSSATDTNKIVRARKGKFSGKWCYRFTVNAAPSAKFSIGFANLDWARNAPLGVPIATIDGGIASAGIAASGQIAWRGNMTNGDPLIAGKTGEACLNLDMRTPHVWFTPDISGTSGPGGGPRWNGSATADPATNTEGVVVWFPRFTFYPAFSGGNNDQVTAAFASFLPPSGYSVWDSAGGEEPDPGPNHPMTIDVANAPEWQASHSYALKDRVVAGPAWNGAAYTNGQDLCLWAVKVAGTSGANQATLNAACANGIPANYGGGLDGTIPTQWNSATTVLDGSVTWVLLTKVDYITLTGAFVDETPDRHWAPSTGYQYLSIVVSDAANAAYENRTGYFGFGPENNYCTSGTTPPIGTGVVGDGGNCGWEFIGRLPYSSQKHIWPHLTGDVPIEPSWSHYVPRYYYDVSVNAWYGGAQRPAYEAGVNNEASPIPVREHESTVGMDVIQYVCYRWWDVNQWGIYNVPCNGSLGSFKRGLTAAPGDSFSDSPGPLRYDETRGVAIHTDGAHPYLGIDYGGWMPMDTTLALMESGMTVTRLQFKADTTIGLVGWFGSIAQDNIIDGGTLSTFDVSQVNNNVIINRNTAPGAIAVYQKYHASVNGNTIIGVNTPDSTAYVAQIAGWNNPAPGEIVTIQDNLVFGFSHFFAHGVTDSATTAWSLPMPTAGNASDIVPVEGTVFTGGPTPWGPRQDFVTQGDPTVLGEVKTGIAAADQFVHPAIGPLLDLRIKPNAPVPGAGFRK